MTTPKRLPRDQEHLPRGQVNRTFVVRPMEFEHDAAAQLQPSAINCPSDDCY